MTIRIKGLLILGTTLITLYVAIFLFADRIIMSSFADFEEEVLIAEMTKTNEVISSELHALATKNLDWSQWDDTYLFIQGQYDAYLAENMDPAHLTLVNMDLNFMAFLDRAGEAREVFFADTDKGTLLEAQDGILGQVIRNSGLLVQGYPDRSFSGLVETTRGILFLSVQRIEDSGGTSPAMGSLLMGRWLDDVLLARMSEVAGGPVMAVPVSDYPHEAASPAIDDGGLPAAPLLVNSSAGTAVAYKPLKDLAGRDIMVLKAEFTREITGRGKDTVNLFMTIISVVFLIIMILAGVIIDWGVLNRLEHLFGQVARVAITGDHQSRIDIAGNDEIATLAISINHMLETLFETDKVLDILVESAMLPMASFDDNGVVTSWNDAAVNAFGWKPEEVIGQPGRLGKSGGSCDLQQLIGIAREKHHMVTCEMEAVRKDSSTFASFIIAAPATGNGGGKMVAVILDVSARTAEVKRIEADLAEKDIMLREVHHRIKNNLQTVSSLLELNALRMYGQEGAGMIRDSQRRIHAMALIHETLYLTESMAEIPLDTYMTSLLDGLTNALGLSERSVTMKYQVDEMTVSSDTAVPCGLIINELVSNSMKYAFEGVTGGVIEVKIAAEDDGIMMRVADNGVGLPEELDIDTSDTLGLMLVRTLAGQLNGTVQVSREGGTSIMIHCKHYNEQMVFTHLA
jgi:PAS domain S-box-containing protein